MRPALAPNRDDTLFLDGVDAEIARRAMLRRGLTEREREVCWLYIHGLPRKLIARDLGMAEETVKRHLAEIAYKSGFDVLSGSTTNPIRLLRLLLGADRQAG